MPRPRCHLDFETFCDINLLQTGSGVYSRRAIPILAGVKVDDEPTRVYDYHEHYNSGVDDFGDFDEDYAIPCPPELVEAARDGWWIVAHNMQFEFDVIERSPALKHWPKISVDRIICTQAKARYWGIPDSLEEVGRVLALDTQKDKEGKRLIQKFCIPQKIGRAKDARKYIKRIDPRDPDWIRFRDVYNHDDVETEYLVDCELPDIPREHARIFYTDFRMNQRGFPVDVPSVRSAKLFYDHFYKQMDKRFKVLSKGLAPTQVAKIKAYLSEAHDEDFENLQSATIRDKLLEEDVNPVVREMLEIRAAAAQASVKKLTAFEKRTDIDLRARGGFLWYGAHTGRWSGKGIQPQNFPRMQKALETSIGPFFDWCERLGIDHADSKGMLDVAELVYPKPLGTLACALKGFIKAEPGKKLYVADYAQIELRVLAWLAGAETTLERLRTGVDPYKAFAAESMYNCSVADVTGYQRQIAKSALLGAQYQIWIDSFIEYCKKTANISISKEEATNAILAYRGANPEIVEYWKDLEEAVIAAVETKGTSRLNNLIIRFEEVNEREWLRVYLPSGRPISYFEPQVRWRTTLHEAKDKEGNLIIGEDGAPVMYERTRKVFSFLTKYMGRIMREYSYGGKLTENVTQGVAADIMGEGLVNVEAAGYLPIATVHDEGVAETDEDFGSIEEFVTLMCKLPDCYEGLPIAAEGHVCTRYAKDGTDKFIYSLAA